MPGPQGDATPTAAETAAQEWSALAPALAARRKMRLSYDGGKTYPRMRRGAGKSWVPQDRVLTRDLPPLPAAVYVYDDHGDTRLLVADFDTKRAAGRGAADAAAQVAADAAAFAQLVLSCGGRGFSDISPNGGRHCYVVWAVAIPHEQMRGVAMALARRFLSLDPTPMLGAANGLIRPPGSPHKSGGFQALTTPLSRAQRCVTEPNGPRVWERLCEALATELEAVDCGLAPIPSSSEETAPPGAQWRTDTAGMPWLPRPGGRVPALRTDMELAAISGQYDTSRRTYAGKPWTDSEARFAVLCSAAARGWQLGEVTAQIGGGRWAGMAKFYSRYPPHQRAKALAADWKKAVAVAAGKDSGRQSNTRENYHCGGAPALRSDQCLVAVSDYQEIRRVEAVMRSVEKQRWPGPGGITIRLVLRAMLAAAQMRGSLVVDFGCRSLAILACCDHTTVARALQQLRDEPDPFIELLDSSRHPGSTRGKTLGDLYMLRVPAACAEAAAWRSWRPGRFGVHPVFHAIGGTAALVCEQLASESVRSTDLPGLTGLSPTATNAALTELASHGIAQRGPGGWVRGPVSLDDAAARLGVPEILANLQAEHCRDRTAWRAFLQVVSTTQAEEPQEDWGWEEGLDSTWEGSLAGARGPPGDDDLVAAIAALEAAFGPVRTITAA